MFVGILELAGRHIFDIMETSNKLCSLLLVIITHFFGVVQACEEGTVDMQEFFISFSSASEVHDFVNIATKQYFPIQVERENQSTDAKSIMSLFSMGLNRPLRLLIPDAGAETEGFLSAVQAYLMA